MKMSFYRDPPVFKRKGVVLLATVLFAAGIGVRLAAQQSAPGLTQRGYVDSKLCASCHAGVYSSYMRTAMARSFARPGAANEIEDHSNKNSFFQAASATWFEMIRRDGQYYQRRYQIGYRGVQANIDETRIDYAIGSGSHARAWLHRTADGKLMQLPLAWYSEDGGHWGMAPGYDSADHQYGRRAVAYECFFCHNAYPEISERNQRLRDEPVYPAELPEGIDCQRCHGPGANHIRAAGEAHTSPESIRKSIVNPARLSPAASLEVCLQCHLQSTSRHLPDSIRRLGRGPFSYVPGQPLADFRISFDRAPEREQGGGIEIDHSAYRLMQSQCFLKSRNALTCVTCHNPHEPLDSGPKAAAHYDSVCRSCHASALEDLVRAGGHPAGGGCIGCHMPKRRTTDVVHVAMTDHLIQRRKPEGDLLAAMPEVGETAANRYAGEVVPLYPAQNSGPESELIVAIAQVQDGSNLSAGLPRLARALSVVYSSRTVSATIPEPWVEYGEALRRDGQIAKAIAAYKEAIARDPSYLAALIGLGSALQEAGQRPQAADTFRQATKADPSDARAWNALGTVELELGHASDALTAFERAAAIDPETPESHNGLGIALTQEHRPLEAEPEFREAIRLMPDYGIAHLNLGQLLMARDDFAQAEWEFETAIRLRPGPSRAELDLGMLLAKNGNRTDAARHLSVAAASQETAIRDLARQAMQKLNSGSR
jgi:tetratricopeptide (TPR) repeat protein